VTNPEPETGSPDTHDHALRHDIEDVLLGGADEGTGEPGDATIEQLMTESIGGWRGLFDTSFPSLVFLLAYTFSGKTLTVAVWAALIAGGLLAVERLVRRRSIRQVLSGLPLLLLSAWLTARSGKAEDFYLPGLWIGAASALGLAISALVGHPIIGYAVGAFTGDLLAWRSVPEQRRAATLATWFFVAAYVLRIVAKLPLYWSGNVEALGTVGLILGWPLTALAAYLSYLVISKARKDAPVPTPVTD
jgi:hypothetical protein